MLAGSIRTHLLGGAAALTLVGCASSPKPIDLLTDSTAALRGAKEVGAENVPPAALEMQRAEDAVQRGRDLMSKDENEKARREFMRARADANLAIALVRRQRAEQAAAKAHEELKAVQQQSQ
jgi:hypothetical protein